MKERGFTLVELMTAVTILVIISGTAYSAFHMALRVYNRETTRMILIQNCRNATNQIADDLGNIYIVQGDTDLLFLAEDIPEDEGEHDTITFVTLIDPRPDPFLAQLSGELGTEELTEEETTQQPQPDLIRVFYYLKVDEQSEQSEFSYDENPPLSLFRATTTGLALSENESIEEIISRGTVIVTTASGEEEEVPIEEVNIADHVQSLDFKYSDGEEWYESWDDTESPPKAVQIIVTVADEGGKGITSTQSTMVYLTLTANFSDEEQQASMPGGGQQ
ncbi:TPA: prepilin-type N-terminal cleavage/methylation domain-containing protein [Candidatus Poribacteria bacterium]|nr:prepilin-type N-terminal cleavage/methylation domain-containing protein [Candidatus Poribacteria bacterium]